MVGSDDEDGVVVNSRPSCSGDKLAHVSVQLLHFLIIFGRVVADTVSDIVRTIVNDSDESRFFLRDIFHRHVAQFQISVFGGCLGIMVQRKRVHQILDAAPFVEHADFRIGRGIPQHGENIGEHAVVVQFAWRQIRFLRSPRGVTVQFGTGTHPHRRPVYRTRRWQHGPLLQGIRSAFHQCLDVGHVAIFHAVASPAIQTDKNDMFSFPCLGFLFVFVHRYAAEKYTRTQKCDQEHCEIDSFHFS